MHFQSDKYCCGHCVNDADLDAFIGAGSDAGDCSYCERSDVAVKNISRLADHMRCCLEQHYGYAVGQLPYVTRDGGYQGPNWDTWDLLQEVVGFTPECHDLLGDLSSEISQETWCEFDWLSLEHDQALLSGWDAFKETVKYRRRFFSMSHEIVDPHQAGQPDYFPISRLVKALVSILEGSNLIRTLAIGDTVYRARASEGGKLFENSKELGPPPPDDAIQANRMSPPGIPVMYASSDVATATQEIGDVPCSVGVFEVAKNMPVLDLTQIPDVPGIFSGCERKVRQGLIFLHQFANEIQKPIKRSKKPEIDYIPSQVFTELIRITPIEGSRVAGLVFRSAASCSGLNYAFFAGGGEIVDSGSPVDSTTKFRLISAQHHESE